MAIFYAAKLEVLGLFAPAPSTVRIELFLKHQSFIAYILNFTFGKILKRDSTLFSQEDIS